MNASAVVAARGMRRIIFSYGNISSGLGQPALEETPLGVRADEGERAVVGRAGLLDAIEPPQQLGARRVQVVVLLGVFAASVRSGRMRSIARLRAVVISQARGLAGVPSRGQRSAAIASAQACEDPAPLLAEDLVEDR